MLIVGSKTQVETVKPSILKKWKSKDLGAEDTFVGFQIQRHRGKRMLRTYYTLYTTKLLKTLRMNNSKPTYIPILASRVLKQDENGLLDNNGAAVYLQIVGSAIYPSNNARPDTSYAVGQLARFMAKPAVHHLYYAAQLLRYLNGTRSIKISYSNQLRERPRT